MIMGPIFGNQFMRIYEFIRHNMEERESLNRINQVLSLKPVKDCGTIALEDIRCIEFQNISFSYDGEINALKNLNLLFEGGRKYALVGPSGSGKTTIIRLILRFWDDYNGKIRINGIDIKEVSLEELLSFISIVRVPVVDALPSETTTVTSLGPGPPPRSRTETVPSSV